jgi:outer membrane lipoprotein SlyB
MKNKLALILATAFLSNFAFAADAAASAAERRYAEDRKLCADEPSSSTRMQCLRDAKAEYDKATGGVAPAAASALPATTTRVACATCGKVLSVRVVEKAGEGSTAGMVAGGLAGALLGNQVGTGGTRTVATIAGAAGGAYAGKKIEESARSTKHWQVAVRFDNGDEKTYSFDQDPGFSAGSEVKASSGGIVAR